MGSQRFNLLNIEQRSISCNILWPWKGPFVLNCHVIGNEAVYMSVLAAASSPIFQVVNQTFQVTAEFLHPLWCQCRSSKVDLNFVDPVPEVPEVNQLSSNAVEVNVRDVLGTRLRPGHVNLVQIVELGLHKWLITCCWPAKIGHFLYDDFQVLKYPKKLGYFGIENTQNPQLHYYIVSVAYIVKLNVE